MNAPERLPEAEWLQAAQCPHECEPGRCSSDRIDWLNVAVWGTIILGTVTFWIAVGLWLTD